MTTSKWLLIGLTMGFLASTVSCGESKTCDQSSCPTGCCNADNECVTNTSGLACGSRGNQCVACGFAQVCLQGQCTGSNNGGSGGTTGGGAGSTGGGSGTTGGGTASNPTCTQLGAAETTFFAGNNVCSYDFDGGFATINASDSSVTACNVVMGNAACTTADRSKMTTYVSCLQAAPACTSGNEQSAVTSALACGQTLYSGLSQACLNAISSPQGGGTGTTGGGSGTTGGGVGTTGGGVGTTGGGVGTTGGGVGTTGGGVGTTGGGVGTTGGGTGNNCSSAAASQTTFFAGRSSCPSSSGTLNPIANLQSICTSSCTTADQSILAGMGTCTSSVPCTTGNENAAYSQYTSCASDAFATLSSPCLNALLAASSTGGGTGTTGGGTGTTGGGTGTTGGGTGSCTAITLGSFSQGFNAGSQYIYQGVFTPNLGTTTTDITQLIFTGTATGTTNFSTSASSNNITTCTRCMVVAQDYANNTFSKLFYATSGSLSVSSSPANGLNPATLTNVTLVEVTLGTGGAVTPVSGGQCLSLASASVTAAAPPVVPSGWVCDTGWYGDGSCDCGCGAQDSDCASTNTVSQCEYCDNCRGTDTTSACSVFINGSNTTQCL